MNLVQSCRQLLCIQRLYFISAMTSFCRFLASRVSAGAACLAMSGRACRMATFLAKSSLPSLCFIVPRTGPVLALSFRKLTDVACVARRVVLLLATFLAKSSSTSLCFVVPHTDRELALRFLYLRIPQDTVGMPPSAPVLPIRCDPR